MKILTLAEKGQYRGSFSNKTKLWEAIQKLEGVNDLDQKLVLIDKRESARSLIVSLTYAKLCVVLKEFGKADIREMAVEEENKVPFIKYAVWQSEVNEVVEGNSSA